MALTEAAKESAWLSQLMHDITGKSGTPMLLYGNNQGSLTLSQDPKFHGRTKHIQLRYHYIREYVENKSIQLQYVPTEDMPADMLTKSLLRAKHLHCKVQLGITTITSA